MSANKIDGECTTQNHVKCATFDEALALAEFGLFNYVLIAISGTILTAVMLEILSTSYVMAVAECELQLTTGQKGILGAVVILGIIVSSHLWGYLADTQGRRKVIVPTLFLAFVTTAVSSFSPNFAWMATSRFLTGFFISGSSASVYAYLGEFHTYARRSNAIMAASFVFGIGCLFLPGLAYITINNDWVVYIPPLDLAYSPWRLFSVVCGLPGLISAIALLKFPESPKFLYNKSRKEQTIEAICWMHRLNTGGKQPTPQIELLDYSESQGQKAPSSSTGVYATLEQIWSQTAPLVMKPYLNRTFLICTLQFGTYFTTHGMFMFFPGVLNDIVSAQNNGIGRTTVCEVVCHTTLNVATYGYTFASDVIYMLGVGLIGLIINTVGRLSILVFIFTCCGIAGILVVFVNLPTVAIWLYIILLLVCYNVNVVNAVAVDLFPTNIRAMAVSISLMFGRLGSIFGTNMNGLLLDTHCELTFWIASGILLLCSVLSFYIPGIRKKNGSKESVSSG